MADSTLRAASAGLLAGVAGLALAAGLVAAERVLAQESEPPTEISQPIPTVPIHNTYGVPGLIDMPVATQSPDATLSTTVATFGGVTRSTLTFQITPRISGSFRYSRLSDADLQGVNSDDTYYDRSFDVRFLLLKESRWLPDLTLGLQDIAGTGLSGAEYVVATKEVLPGLRVTGGLGWGRLGTEDPFTSTGERPNQLIDTGGQLNTDRYFRGDVAGFGGVSYDVNERLRLAVEYSSDAYLLETRRAGEERSSPWNYGIDYRFRNGTQLSLFQINGTETGVKLSLPLNPKIAPVPGGSGAGPLPVRPRSQSDIADLGWTTDPSGTATRRKALADALDEQGITLEGLEVGPRRAVARIVNRRYHAVSEAVGRTTRTMTRVLPGSVETLVVVPVENGIPASAISLSRRDLEAHEFDAAALMFPKTRFSDAAGLAPAPFDDAYPSFDWGLSPFASYSAFDPDDPFRVDFGLRLSGDYRITPGLSLSGAVSTRLAGNIGESNRRNNTQLPAVRTDFKNYAENRGPVLDRLTLQHVAHPVKDIYSRVTVGYLERMYAGASAELLWKPVTSRLALGAEVNYVRKRDYDGGLGLTDNITTNDIDAIEREIPNLNGHLSAYYKLGSGFHAQVDAGRYLAGDYGATLSLKREFANGWKIGAFATKTDVSSEQFGEGSFDKGVTLEIPLNWVLGEPTRSSSSFTVRPVTRDGGARLRVQDRLYESVRDAHQPEAAESWGRFWR
ncbi:YjbH domain-containing protein [Litorisediminicola beolgyonensis]|uniref:YjbH domain-containing protein n=1 Tax=Litorisediminicola beolgyonensis TaxID=1173614 RepID=A0ABW3ZGG2_9RHOB